MRIAPIAIGTAGEGLGATDKKTLEDAFGCEATNSYGSSEHLMMGSALPGGASMLLSDDDLIYEPFEDHTLVSNLFNYTLPLIRYRMADVLRPVKQKIDPNSPYLEIESLVGRTEMMPRFTNWRAVSPRYCLLRRMATASPRSSVSTRCAPPIKYLRNRTKALARSWPRFRASSISGV